MPLGWPGLDVPVVRQLTTLTEVVDVRCRAAKELRNLGHIERCPAFPRPAAWHTPHQPNHLSRELEMAL